MREYKTAVMILAHHNIEYIYELARANPDVYFVVHYDLKTEIDMSMIVSHGFQNLKLLENRISVHWAGYSQVQATLMLIEKTIEVKSIRFLHLISAECYPLVSFSEMEEEWSKSPQINYIESHPRPDNAWRVSTWMPHANTRHMRTFWGRVLKRMLRLTSGFINTSGITTEPYYGSLWFSITRELAEKMVSANNSENFFSKFSRITCSDEHAFSMFVREHKICCISDNNRRFIKFPPGGSNPCYLDIKQVVEYNNTLRAKYWFARKFTQNMMLTELKK